MHVSIHKWLYIKLVIFLMVIFGPFNQATARSFIGLRGAIGGVHLLNFNEYATAHGYKDVETPFGHLDLEGSLCMESKTWNHMSSRLEFGFRYIHASFTGREADQNTIKQSIGLHCRGVHLSWLCYFYPGGRFADNGRWNGHIGVSVSTASSKTKKNDKCCPYCLGLSPDWLGLILGIGFEFMSNIQLECRYRCGRDLMNLCHLTNKPGLHGISLGVGYLFL